MDQMKRDGIRLAISTFDFTWADRGKKLEGWTLAGMQYYRDYDRLMLVTEQQENNLVHEDGLQEELAAAALPLAKNGFWIDYPSEERGEGCRRVFLADNEWLPFNGFPPTFTRYDPGTTPLMHAAVLGDVMRIRRLLAARMPVDAASPDGSTALIYAAGRGNPAVVEALLGAGADTTRNTKDGNTALINATASGSSKMVSLLLRAGANPNSRNHQGDSPLSIAIRRHYEEVAALLEEAGANK